MEDSEKILDVAEPVEEVAEETTVVDENTQEEASEEFTEKDVSTDSDEKSETTETEKKVQTDEENANYAQIRRKAEEDANKKIEEAKAKAYEEGKLAVYKGKINPYTNRPITDLADAEMYETMYQLEQDGKDPINDLPDALLNKRKEENRVIQEKKNLEEKTKKEVDEFVSKYPDVNLKELLDDSFFNDYIRGKDNSLTELYEGFNNFKNAFRNSAIEVAKQTIANAQATPGSLNGDSDDTINYSNMSDAEFEKMIQKAKDGEL